MMQSGTALAHSANSYGRTQTLRAHLVRVGSLAESFASRFGAGLPARYAGLWHDIGKINPDFQKYLEGKLPRGPDHKIVGAALAFQHEADILALAIAGHHGGLPSRSELQLNLKDEGLHHIIALAEECLPEIAAAEAIRLPDWLHTKPEAEIFTRLLFSALVDADFLDTEQHFNEERSAVRQRHVSLSELWKSFTNYQHRLAQAPPTPVNLVRRDVYQSCLYAAELSPGIFRLTVPTGGGKTLSGMGFALRHALNYAKERVIFAIPFTSIVEQTADVYRAVFGEGVVLEHHSAAQPSESADPRGEAEWARLAAENWDARVIVTTNVQLFESLFADRPSRCRKLHRIAHSVIILDEVQTLPPPLLQPILDVLKELVAHYNVSVVLCTATQPALEIDSIFLRGVREVRDIIPNAAALFTTLRRVRYERPVSLTWEDVAAAMRSNPQVLAIVNTKKDALALLDTLADPEALHLSTLLCGAHRREVLAEVRARLADGHPCRLVSTQVVEAGVDLDFPVVCRAVGPLDRIVQAAGRCNREGGLPHLGRVILFEVPMAGLPPGPYHVATDITRGLLREPELDFDDPTVFERYFSMLWQNIDVQAREIQQARREFDFPLVSKLFRMVTDDTIPVVVHYYHDRNEQQEVETLVEQLRSRSRNPRMILRRLQPYIVAVRPRAAEGCVTPITDGLWEWTGDYDQLRGVVLAAHRDVD